MVMVIVGILTAIAIPSYWAYVARSNRSEARSQLLIAANWVERWRTQSGSYQVPYCRRRSLNRRRKGAQSTSSHCPFLRRHVHHHRHAYGRRRHGWRCVYLD